MKNERAIHYIESTATHCRDELIVRLGQVADIHAQYAACHSGGSRRIGLNMAEVARSARDWLVDQRQHPRSFAVWCGEATNRLVIVLNACGRVNGSTPMELEALLD